MLNQKTTIKVLKISIMGILITSYYLTGLIGLGFMGGLLFGELVAEKVFTN